MLTNVIVQLLLAGVIQAPSSLDLQAQGRVVITGCAAGQVCVVAYEGPVHGPDPNREIHDSGMPTNNRDPYGGTTGNGSDVYGGRYGGSDPYGGRTSNGRTPY